MPSKQPRCARMEAVHAATAEGTLEGAEAESRLPTCGAQHETCRASSCRRHCRRHHRPFAPAGPPPDLVH